MIGDRSEDAREGATPTTVLILILILIVTSSYSRRTRRPSETCALCGGLEPRDGGRGTGSGRAEERRRSARNPARVVDAMYKTGETRAEGEKYVDKKGLVQ